MGKKFKPNIKGFFNKKENVAVVAVAVIICAGAVITTVKNNGIPLHDGDVLVDSRNVAVNTEESADKSKDEKDVKDADAAKSSGFDEERANLELERNDLIAKYDDTIKNTGSNAEKKDATAQKKKLIGYMEQEVSIEGIIKTKNLPECFVIITDNKITVTVDQQELKQDTVTKICTIVMDETGRTADKIIIQSSY